LLREWLKPQKPAERCSALRQTRSLPADPRSRARWHREKAGKGRGMFGRGIIPLPFIPLPFGICFRLNVINRPALRTFPSCKRRASFSKLWPDPGSLWKDWSSALTRFRDRADAIPQRNRATTRKVTIGWQVIHPLRGCGRGMAL